MHFPTLAKDRDSFIRHNFVLQRCDADLLTLFNSVPVQYNASAGRSESLQSITLMLWSLLLYRTFKPKHKTYPSLYCNYKLYRKAYLVAEERVHGDEASPAIYNRKWRPWDIHHSGY